MKKVILLDFVLTFSIIIFKCHGQTLPVPKVSLITTTPPGSPVEFYLQNFLVNNLDWKFILDSGEHIVV